MSDIETLAMQFSAWEIAQALRLSLESFPESEERKQTLHHLDELVRLGGPRLILGWRK